MLRLKVIVRGVFFINNIYIIDNYFLRMQLKLLDGGGNISRVYNVFFNYFSLIDAAESSVRRVIIINLIIY